MHFLAFFLALLSSTLASPILLNRTALFQVEPAQTFFTLSARPTISASVYQDFVRYTQYSSLAYYSRCDTPLGNTRVVSLGGTNGTPTGFIARDDVRHEIVVAFRGTLSVEDVVTDIKLRVAPYPAPPGHGDPHVHRGFLNGYNGVATKLEETVKNELTSHPTYTVVVTGHSLGGAYASLAAVALKVHLSTTGINTNIKLYTFGQPRVGNKKFADYAERLLRVENIFRVVHANDAVPTVLIGALTKKLFPMPHWHNHWHFGTEYWQSASPADGDQAPHSTVVKCSGREDKKCSGKWGLKKLLFIHTRYFGEQMAIGNCDLCR
ncbi:Alpha/Beta hydrolase protein [Mycena filopes]|nr:Alpha/Beta hydrolase protein [Mycena filopes]